MNEDIAHSLLLPYQIRWVADRAGLKVIEKSRRIGISWAEAYDAVVHAGGADGGNVYYQAYNLQMTRGFIEDCADWARKLQSGPGTVGETLVDEGGRSIRAFRIGFPSRREILAMTSAPRAFRSKGRPGDLAIVDEAAFVDDLGEVLKAALAFRIWGGRAHVISTHNGEANPFAVLCQEIRKGVQPGSLHRVTLGQALEEGFYRCVSAAKGQPWSAEGEAAWEAGLRAELGSHAGEELDCIPAAGAGAWLAWAAIRACEDPAAGEPAAFTGGAATIGVDVARRRDLWVAAVLEQVGDVLWLRDLEVRQGIPFSAQRAIVGSLAAQYRPTRIAVDQTGMGEAVVEQLQDDLGRTVVEGVLMTGPRRLDVASALREAVEDRRLRIPVRCRPAPRPSCRPRRGRADRRPAPARRALRHRRPRRPLLGPGTGLHRRPRRHRAHRRRRRRPAHGLAHGILLVGSRPWRSAKRPRTMVRCTGCGGAAMIGP